MTHFQRYLLKEAELLPRQGRFILKWLAEHHTPKTMPQFPLYP